MGDVGLLKMKAHRGSRMGVDLEEASPLNSVDGYKLVAHTGDSLEMKHESLLQPPKEFVCPISLDVMAHPVTLVETGQSFDRCNLECWFKTGAHTCPLTGATLSSKEMRPNADLQQSIREWYVTGKRRKTASLPTIATTPVSSGEDIRKQYVHSRGTARIQTAVETKTPALPQSRVSRHLFRLFRCFGPSSKR